MSIFRSAIAALVLATVACAAGATDSARTPGANELRLRLKALGVGPDSAAALDALVVAIDDGRIDTAAQDACLASIPDPTSRAGARRLLARGGAPEAVVGGPSDVSPRLGGTCATCPDHDFGPFGMTTSYQTHCSLTSSTTDCNTYLFDVTPGTTVEFTTCAPGSAAFDTALVVMRADTCQQLAAENDNCGAQTRVVLLVPAGVTQLLVQVAGLIRPPLFGDYCLAWQERPPCATCASPRPGIYVPDMTCGQLTDILDPCRDNYYQFLLTAGTPYEFATCRLQSSTCSGATGGDSVISIHDPASCAVVASNDDNARCAGAPFASHLRFTPTVSGIHVVRVGEALDRSNLAFTLAYAQMDCDVPAVASVTPASGVVAAGTCSAVETFAISLTDGYPAGALWTITPPPGGSATPASGSLSFSGIGMFTSTLARPPCSGASDFTVAVQVLRVCGSAEETITYSLADSTRPHVVGCPASLLLDCAAPVPPAPTLTATDNCDPAPVVSFSETPMPGGCPGNSSILRTWTATDCSGNTQICLQNIVLRDRTAPSLSGSDSWCMHPVNHEYYCITPAELAATMSDDCSSPAQLTFVGCTSSEPDTGTSPDDMPDDCIIAPDGSEACFRVERAGTSVDRTYVLTGVAVDACGNRSAPQPVATATVPRDDAPHPECRPSDSGLDKHY